MGRTIVVNVHHACGQTTPSSKTLSVALTAIQSAMGVRIHPTNCAKTSPPNFPNKRENGPPHDETIRSKSTTKPPLNKKRSKKN